jgi:CHAT domain-containing protein
VTIEERAILALILASNVPHISTVYQADALFKLAQYLNRDKEKLGVNERVSVRQLNSDLQREDIRTRDRLKDLRERMLDDATTSLLARVLPIRPYTVVQNVDFGSLLRLEDIEDKITNADEQLRRTVPDFSSQGADRLVDLSEAQRLLRSNEALVLHNVGVGLVTTCINSDTWTFKYTPLTKSDTQQRSIDEKLLMAAVHGTNQPSADLDSSFPAESAYQTYQLFLGGLEGCLKGRNHILLATDPDFFALPWNALLVEPAPKNSQFSLRLAPRLPKFYGLSLLPSVRSIFQLRVILPQSRAHQKFLAVGDPDFRGTDRSAQPTLGPLFSSRGVADRDAIASLPRLPETADELRSVARALGAPSEGLLLGREATERALRQHPLNDYRVISFATHAIVAGEIEGVTEPALVLSPGKEQNNPQSDGLLTATKIANLTLDANLVVLSACDTASSDGHASGRGLSGLANAFFFAGARALAVTQWAVLTTAAQELGAGLVSRSMKSRSFGISEGLRQAMIQYIADAKEDYLANPRFWSAYIIAGDGAVGPLDAITDQTYRENDVINLEWDRVTQDPQDDELFDVTRNPLGDSFYAIGIERPPVGGKQAGSYLTRIYTDGRLHVLGRSPNIAASGVVGINGELVELGYQPADQKTTAVVRSLDRNGQEHWQHLDESDLFSLPVGLVKTSRGIVLISMEADYSPSQRPASLVLTLLSEEGRSLMRERYGLPIQPTSYSKRNVLLDSNGNLIIAIGGRPSTPGPKNWTNPLTGTIRYCVSPEATAFFHY